jgi:F-type H+-transporting ATPase subunit delta
MRDTLVIGEIVEPYAQALMSVAQANELVDRFGEDVAFLLSLLNQSEELRQLLTSPLVKSEVKKGVLEQVAGEQVHSYMLNFLRILVDRGRVLFLEGICKQYQSLLRELRQTVLAEVISAVDLSEAQEEAVRQKVLDLVGAQQVELEKNIDPDLIGGVIIKVGSQVIDASLRGQLRRIGLRLSSAT